MSAVVIQQKKMMRRFLMMGACTPDSAQTLDALGLRRGFVFRRLEARGVLCQTQDERYYLDEVAMQRFRNRQRFFAFGLLAAWLIVFALLWIGGKL